MTDFIQHPSGLVFPVEVHPAPPPRQMINPGNMPEGWPGSLSDPDDREAADRYLQGMYRSLGLHRTNGMSYGPSMSTKECFRMFADYLLGEWHYDGEEYC